MIYLVLKLVHLIAVVLFLGNITTGVLWKAHADRTRDPRIIAHTLDGIIRSDRWFTMPGVVVIVLGGFGAAGVGNLPILGTGWIFWSLVLFTVSGLAFMLRVAPLQRRMASLAGAAATEERALDWSDYRTQSRAWELWGAVATLAAFGAMALMVLKPRLPGL